MFLVFTLLGIFILFSCSPKAETKHRYKYTFPENYEKPKRSKGSLFTSPQKAYLYGSVRASQVGDIIYVRVIESINAIESISTNIRRNSAFSNAIGAFFGVPASTLRNLGSQAESSFRTRGDSNYQQRGVLTTTLAGRVIKVFPNGTMLIEAKKYIEVNGVKREFVLRGIVRPEDIDSTNTITSDKIANMEVFFDGKGYVLEGGKPGWLARIFSIIFPF